MCNWIPVLFEWIKRILTQFNFQTVNFECLSTGSVDVLFVRVKKTLQIWPLNVWESRVCSTDPPNPTSALLWLFSRAQSSVTWRLQHVAFGRPYFPKHLMRGIGVSPALWHMLLRADLKVWSRAVEAAANESITSRISCFDKRTSAAETTTPTENPSFTVPGDRRLLFIQVFRVIKEIRTPEPSFREEITNSPVNISQNARHIMAVVRRQTHCSERHVGVRHWVLCYGWKGKIVERCSEQFF